MRKKAVVFLSVCMIIMCSCGNNTQSTNEDSETTNQVIVETVNEKAEEAIEESRIYPEFIEIDTPYISLFCPGIYEDEIVSDITEDENTLINISSASSVGDVFLYGIGFGYEEKDNVIGTIEIDGETIYISAEQYELSLDERWSDDEKSKIKDIQEKSYEYTLIRLRETDGVVLY